MNGASARPPIGGIRIMSKMMGVALAATMMLGCGTPSETAESNEALRLNCAAVLCLACAPDQVAVKRGGQCCPTCVDAQPKVQAGDCACYGGHMSADYCAQFGAPWSWEKWACFWDARAQGGLTSEQCAAVEAKHAGDGSGSDIYNLGLTCEYGASDCRNKGCPQ